MDQYQILKKVLGSKKCPQCNKTLRISENFAICVKCDFSQELNYKDSKRNKKEKERVQYRKLEDFLPVETE